MLRNFSKIPDKVITICFYLLFFLVPLILTPFNYELFEYNKMMLVYALTTVAVSSWIIKMIIEKQVRIVRTFLDIPIILYLISQIISTFFSIDPHVSIWGYYSRFNGGLLSTFSYILLYYAFVTNFPKEKINKLIKIILTSALLVATYGILEHFGIDKDIWVQDVQNRVFSTLGQPNWLAAYLAVLIPITIGIALQYFTNQSLDHDAKIQNAKVKSQNYNSKVKIIGLLDNWIIGLLVFISSVFYITLVFTKSRSGFLGFWVANGIFWSILFLRFKQDIVRLFIIFNFAFLIFNFLFGTPFPQINRFTLSELFINQQPITGNQQPTKPAGGSVIEVGITESGTIRRIVWQGAIDIWRHYPLFGSGVESFAFAYYKFRPPEHNMTSEWDFLYNKAHNEYLNFAATTGSLGLGSYLLIIIFFIVWSIKKLKTQNSNVKTTSQNSKLERFKISDLDLRFEIIHFGLFSAWFSILVTNFFGFSVVIIQLFFFLIPAISFVLSDAVKPVYLFSSKNNLAFRSSPKQATKQSNNLLAVKIYKTVGKFQLVMIIFVLFFIFYILYFISKLWYADVIFAQGYHSLRSGEYASSYQMLRKAILLNDSEPLYYDEFSYPAAELAVFLYDDKQSTLSSQLENEAIAASTEALNISPNNVNFWKTRTRVFYLLSQTDDKYLTDALKALEQAKILSLTDPKVRYNLALVYEKIGKREEGIKELIETTKLKPDYRDAYFALAFFYEKNKQKDKAREMLQFILTRIATDDAETKKKLEELK